MPTAPYSSATPPPKKSSNTWLIVVIVVVVLCCLCVVLIAVLYPSFKDQLQNIINNSSSLVLPSLLLAASLF
jgi:predicted PurR-regulated permease PerM